MLRSIRDMIHLRWRTAQLLLILMQGDLDQVRALRAAMRVEGFDDADMGDELKLMLRQFGHRSEAILGDEVTRLWRQLTQLCARCDRPSRHLDNDGVCYRCILAEGEP